MKILKEEQAFSRVGGIVGVIFVSGGGDYESHGVEVRSCVNNGSVTNINEGIGGIAGSLGVPDSDVSVVDCTAKGKFSFPDHDVDAQMEEFEKGQRLELSGMGSAIVCRLGSGMCLTTQIENRDASAVNNPYANIFIIQSILFMIK